MVTAVPYGSSHYTVIQQTLYECRARQDGWIRQPPIEFGWIKLTHAANPKYLDTPGHDDKVLKYEGVGSSITCRLNVCQTPQPPQALHIKPITLS